VGGPAKGGEGVPVRVVPEERQRGRVCVWGGWSGAGLRDGRLLDGGDREITNEPNTYKPTLLLPHDQWFSCSRGRTGTTSC
jgi:hypothetical protein